MDISDTHPPQRPTPAGVGGAVSTVPAVGTRPAASAGKVAAQRPGQTAAFQQELARARHASLNPDAADQWATVKRGDTLTGLVRAQWAAQGQPAEGLSAGQAHRWALQVARQNGLTDPDRIHPGQQIRLGAQPLSTTAVAPRAAAVAMAGPLPRPVVALPTSAARPLPPVGAPTAVTPAAMVGGLGALSHPVLSQTLDRAVDLGFIPATERLQVQARIAELADKHGFKPDDFAKAALMESDGFNPRASNGNCHGIIQFCAGPDRGAASAGYGQQPKAILDLSVLRQLDLVDRYFDDTRLRDFKGQDGRVRLDDLYLTILTPAARQERRLGFPLPIAGPQAADLHVRRDRQAPITRTSILAGLNANARTRLGQFIVADLSTP